MSKKFVTPFFAFWLFFWFCYGYCFGQASKEDSTFVTKTVYPATTLLYGQSDGGDMKMRCTATAIEKNATGYVFATAAHCACEDNEETHTASAEKVFFFITSDDQKEKTFLAAKPIACGYQHAGDDFSLFQVDTDSKFPVVELGEDAKPMDAIANVASPLGLGRQIFVGSVTATDLQRPVVLEDINWTHTALLQLFGTDGGSSGSAVICLDQKKICAFVVGTYNRSSIVAMPVSRLVKMRADLKAGTYKHYEADPDAIPGAKKGAK